LSLPIILDAKSHSRIDKNTPAGPKVCFWTPKFGSMGQRNWLSCEYASAIADLENREEGQTPANIINA